MLSLRLARPLSLSSRAFSSSAFALAHHRVVVVGAGTAGVTVAAQLPRASSAIKASDIAILDPSATHSCESSSRALPRPPAHLRIRSLEPRMTEIGRAHV